MKRKALNVSQMEQQKRDWDQKHPSHVDQRSFIMPEYYCEKPKFMSMS